MGVEGCSEKISRKQHLSQDLGVSVENQGQRGQARADAGTGPVQEAERRARGRHARGEGGGSVTVSLVASLLGPGLDQRGHMTSSFGTRTSIQTS